MIYVSSTLCITKHWLKLLLGLTFMYFSIIFSGCATSKMTAVTKVKPSTPYVNLMVVFVKDAPEIMRLDETTYNANIKNKFNNLNDIKLRKHLEKTFAKNVGTSATLVNQASNYFGIGEEIDYQSFITKIKETGAEGIIIVNSNARWNNESYTTYNLGKRNPVSYADNEISPNSSFLCYLIDLNSGTPVWMGQSNVYGTTLDTYNTLSNSLAHDVGDKLKKEGFIYKLVSDLPLSFNVKNSTVQ